MRTRRFTARAVLALTLVLIVPAADVAARPRAPKPRGYSIAKNKRIAPGLRHITLRKRAGADQVVHVARLGKGSDLRIQPVPSRGNKNGKGPRLEPTSRLCRRVQCLAAVNADFFRSGRPVGGIVLDGRQVKPPRGSWVQAVFDDAGRMSTRTLRLSGEFLSSDLRRLRIRRVDPTRKKDLALYTGAHGNRTPKGRSYDVVLETVNPKGPLRIGQTSVVRIARFHKGKGRTWIPPGGAVLSARGPAVRRIKRLHERVRRGKASRASLIRLRSTPDAWDTVGGRPVIVRKGRPVVRKQGMPFVRGRHPRTLLGRTKDGSVLMVTVDGRRRGRSGMSLMEAARLMIRLGAVEAINLDGGGSTTFVVRGRVKNRPSDGRERPVAVALAVVRKSHGLSGPRTPRLGKLELGRSPRKDTAVRRPDGEAAQAAILPSPVSQASEGLPMVPIAGAALLLATLLMIVRIRARRRLGRLARAGPAPAEDPGPASDVGPGSSHRR